MKRIILFLALTMSILNGYSQENLGAYLSRLYDMQDNPQVLREALCKVSQSQIEAAPDSVKFDYYYLSGAADEIEGKHGVEKVQNLKLAKELCEKSLGIHSLAYLEVLGALAAEDEYQENYDEAYAVYLEGIVKGLSLKGVYPQQFSVLVVGVGNCCEKQGKLDELLNHYRGAWEFWDKDQTPFSSYNYYPLWLLQDFYYRYERYDEALQVSDEIGPFIIDKVGDNHFENASELYFKGNILSAQKKYAEACSIYENGIDVCKMNVNNPQAVEQLSFLYGNLLTATANAEGVDERSLNSQLRKIKDYGSHTNNVDIYKNSLFTLAKVLRTKKLYSLAGIYISRLLNENLSEQERQVISRLQDENNYYQYLSENVEKIRADVEFSSKGSDAWLDASRNLSIALYSRGEIDASLQVLKEMYSCVSPQNVQIYNWAVSHLISSMLEMGKYDEALPICDVYSDFVRKTFGEQDGRYILAVNNCVVTKLRLNRTDGVEEDLETVASRYQEQFGEESAEFASYLHNYGRYLQLSGNLEKAKVVYLKAISLQNKTEGKPMPKTVSYLSEVNNQLNSRL